MQKKELTILTPTFNRAYILENLYRSLASQTDKNFTWLVVDDGSSDNIKELIKSFQEENQIEIVYIHQVNSGKYVAHNTGVRSCSTELIVCVDSDDELYPNAVEKTLCFWQKYKDNPAVCGIVSPRDIGGIARFINPPETGCLMDLYNSGRLVGDTMLVFRTNILKEYLFPEIKGETFMSECVIYNQIDLKYVFAVQDEYLYKGEYRNDGLTLNIDKTHWKNPKTTLIMYRAEAAFQKNTLKAVKAYGAYLAWKKARNLPSCGLYKVKPHIAAMGALLYMHYFKLFNSRRENMA